MIKRFCDICGEELDVTGHIIKLPRMFRVSVRGGITHYFNVQTSDNKPDDGLILIGTQYIEFEKICLNHD